jgi:hypothetical protein
MIASLCVFIYPAHLHGKQYEKFVDAEEKFFNEREKLLTLMGDGMPTFYEQYGKCPQSNSVAAGLISSYTQFLSDAESLASTRLEHQHMIGAYLRLGHYLAQCGDNQLAEVYFRKANKISRLSR